MSNLFEQGLQFLGGPVGSAIAGPVGAVAGSIISGTMANKNAQSARQWSTLGSKTAHQNEVKDLRKAGLNPILSASGSGATFPSTTPAQTPDYAGAFNQGVGAIKGLAEGKTAGIQASQAQDMLSFYKRHPEVKEVLAGANLAKNAGLDPRWGAAFGGLNTLDKSPAGKKGKNYVKRAFKGAQNKLLDVTEDFGERVMDGWYDELNGTGQKLNDSKMYINEQGTINFK